MSHLLGTCPGASVRAHEHDSSEAVQLATSVITLSCSTDRLVAKLRRRSYGISTGGFQSALLVQTGRRTVGCKPHAAAQHRAEAHFAQHPRTPNIILARAGACMFLIMAPCDPTSPRRLTKVL